MQLQAIVIPLYAGMHLFAVLSKNITDITSRKFVSTSQLGNLFSDVSVAYSYHHQGIMYKEALMHI